MKELFLKQYNIGTWYGGVKDLYSRALTYQSFVNLFLLSVTAYTVILKDYIANYAPWITFPMFFFFFIALIALAMLFEYKFAMPSAIAWANAQGYKHQNLVRKQLDGMTKENEDAIKGIYQQLKVVNEKLNLLMERGK